MERFTIEEKRRSHSAAVKRWRAKRVPKKGEAVKAAAVTRAWRKANPEKYRGNHLQRKYGLSLDQHDALLQKQKGCCAVCKAIEPGGKGTWHLDHCHDTKKIRGLLCRRCNMSLGFAKDSSQLLRALADYLERTDD